jgi:hypothetical protein
MNVRVLVPVGLLGVYLVSAIWLQLSYANPYALAGLPGEVAADDLMGALRAGEQKKYPQCRSLGTTCSYTNVCGLDPDEGGCLNTDPCPSCTGGTDASCTGPKDPTKCIDDTLDCCYLGKSCELRTTGCTCTNQGAAMAGTIQFCGG